ncbi:MAG TPA: condensation domain-containing protein, partial [Lacunisphaera sp.]
MTQGLPATPLQQQIFEFQRRFPRSSAYNICYLYKLSGALDLPKFQETVQSIIDSNPVFSSVFVHSGTQVFQTRSANRVQVGVLPAAEMDEAQLVDLLRARARKPMDLTTGPLADICVAVGATASFFLVNAHHAIFDISSLEVFLRQVETGYANGAAVTPLPQFDEYLARPRCTELVEPALGQLRELFAGSASFATD